MPNKFILAVSSPNEKTVKREFTNFVFFFFFFKPAISLPEQVQVIIFPPSVSRVARGVHGHQAIFFLQRNISAVDREVHPSRHKTTPFLKALRHGPPTRKQLASKSGHGSIIVSDWSKISFNFTAFPHENNACG